jgi:hypothetical protein
MMPDVSFLVSENLDREFLRHATIGAGAEAARLTTKEYRAPRKLPRV